MFSKNKLAIGVKISFSTKCGKWVVYAELVTYVQTVGERGGKGVRLYIWKNSMNLTYGQCWSQRIQDHHHRRFYNFWLKKKTKKKKHRTLSMSIYNKDLLTRTIKGTLVFCDSLQLLELLALIVIFLSIFSWASRRATTFVSVFVISDKAAATSLDCLWSDGDGLDDLALQDDLLWICFLLWVGSLFDTKTLLPWGKTLLDGVISSL